MKSVLVIVVLAIFSIKSSWSQEAYIGKSADKVIDYCKYWEQEKGIGLFHKMYEDGELSGVYLMFSNTSDLDFDFVATRSIIFSLKDGVCNEVKIEYVDMSKSKLKTFYVAETSDFNAVGNYFFAPNYKTYRVLSENILGDAVVKIKKTDVKKLSSGTRAKVNTGILEYEKQEAQKEKEKAERLAKEKAERTERLSKVLALDKESPEQYQRFVEQLTDNLMKEFDYNRNSLTEFCKSKRDGASYFEYKNIYAAKFTRKHNGQSGEYEGDFESNNEFKLVAGINKSLSYIKEASFDIPCIFKEGYHRNTELTLSKIETVVVEGETEIKLKNGVLTYVNKTPLDYIQKELEKEVKERNEANGKYVLSYYYIKVFNKEQVRINLKKKKSALDVAKGLY
ncbi:MAG: hypothetical protein N4A35_14900 [Flavobacteriales bacterium]|jgi:hypothetical protein|nr:hypothetical protein [Flavobacteriales bacterium]